MTTVTQETIMRASIDYGGDPPAPTAARQTVRQDFDDGTSRVIERECALSDLTAAWDAALVAQRDQQAQKAGALAAQVNDLRAQLAALAPAEPVQ